MGEEEEAAPETASILTMVYPVTAGSTLAEEEEEEEDVANEVAETMMGVAPAGTFDLATVCCCCCC